MSLLLLFLKKWIFPTSDCPQSYRCVFLDEPFQPSSPAHVDAESSRCLTSEVPAAPNSYFCSEKPPCCFTENNVLSWKTGRANTRCKRTLSTISIYLSSWNVVHDPPRDSFLLWHSIFKNNVHTLEKVDGLQLSSRVSHFLNHVKRF